MWQHTKTHIKYISKQVESNKNQFRFESEKIERWRFNSVLNSINKKKLYQQQQAHKFEGNFTIIEF